MVSRFVLPIKSRIDGELVYTAPGQSVSTLTGLGFSVPEPASALLLIGAFTVLTNSRRRTLARP